MIGVKLLEKGARLLPRDLRALGKRIYYRDRISTHPNLKKFGTVQDLYYWTADGDLDTLLLLQNYFSAFYPKLNTGTKGSVSLYSKEAQFLTEKHFVLPHCGAARFRVSSLLEEAQESPQGGYGTLEVNIAIPKDVLAHIQSQPAMYFWDRFYIGYVNAKGQTCFVHGVDKTDIYRDGKPGSEYWYDSPGGLQWAPEMPLNIDEYKNFSVIMVNRTPSASEVTLTVTDTNDETLSWSVPIPSRGVHRFELTKENTSGLVPDELRMKVSGMATRFGRPTVFKEFPNGAISAMHC